MANRRCSRTKSLAVGPGANAQIPQIRPRSARPAQWLRAPGTGIRPARRRQSAPHFLAAAEVDLAIRRICLIHSVILTIGGIPLIYLNDEVGVLNDYGFRADPAKAHDSRWVHRPTTDLKKVELRHNLETVEGKIFQNLKGLIKLRKTNPVFAGSEMQILQTGHESVFGYLRASGSERVLIFANFSEGQQTIPANLLRLYGLSYSFEDLLSEESIPFTDLTLAPYQFVCLRG